MLAWRCNLDRFSEGKDEKPKLFSNCCTCDKELFIGDEIVEWYGQVACDEYKCVLKMVDAQRKVAEDDV